jgi:hypothetical protein
VVLLFDTPLEKKTRQLREKKSESQKETQFREIKETRINTPTRPPKQKPTLLSDITGLDKKKRSKNQKPVNPL